jgi:hypothetical protein
MAWEKKTTCAQCNGPLSKEELAKGFRVCESCVTGRPSIFDATDEPEDSDDNND